MSRKIGVAINFLNDSRKTKLENAAKKHGFEMKIFDFNNVTAKDVEDCEVLFGSFDNARLMDAKELKWIHCSFAGVDRYMAEGVFYNEDAIITNSAGAYGITISEHIIGVLLMMMRRMPEYLEISKKREWYHVGDVRSIMGSTITVIGAGGIGSSFAHRAKAMGATVRGVRRSSAKLPECFDETYTTDGLNDALEGADVVVACVPHTSETGNMINAERFSHMKDGALFVNVGRGSAVDQDALCDALHSGKLAGAAIDVTVPEPLPKDHPLWSAPNILITPHISGNVSLGITCEILTNMFIENLERYANGAQMKCIVDKRAGY